MKLKTMVDFENIDLEEFSGIERTPEGIAVELQFHGIDPNFKTYANGEQVTLNDQWQVSDSTEFCWKTDDFSDPLIESSCGSAVVWNI